MSDRGTGRQMNRSLVLGELVSLQVFYALMDREFWVILVAVIYGDVASTLLSETPPVLLQLRIAASILLSFCRG